MTSADYVARTWGDLICIRIWIGEMEFADFLTVKQNFVQFIALDR